MDPVTQGALGAACAQAVLHKKDKHNAWIVGALAGMAADLDIFIRSSQDPLLFFIYHRHFTHSLFFIPFGGILVTLFLCLFQRFRRHWRLTLIAALIGYATHGLLDAFTSYGTILYWPFNDKRVSWDIISIIDPFFTFPLILGLVWTLVFDSRRGVLAGLLLAGMVLVFNTIQHHRVIVAMHKYAVKHAWKITRQRAMPHFASSIYWRVLAVTSQKEIFMADVHAALFSPVVVHPLQSFPILLKEEIPEYVQSSSSLMQDFRVFNWFTDNYLIALCKNPLSVVDARFIFGNNALWGFVFIPNREHGVLLRSINLDDKNAYCNFGNRK
ncbi:membrane-bound metal-dependent hydrolase (plasmid) [Legionella adelaidensis]|uniref:Integral membrane protein n=1 Tax=Legionella adelaidensis TaxID=45056 RepID=A0A0W0R3L4_9GAMM|nr:metal-dependent hydrolase [Legionella adelaidensis]KTC65628.1 integral membrane protein [Legionella adelaidensis]VEH85175.1 membrane-bound metal-dependent hydrolase [Legionella adelaidensis]